MAGRVHVPVLAQAFEGDKTAEEIEAYYSVVYRVSAEWEAYKLSSDHM